MKKVSIYSLLGKFGNSKHQLSGQMESSFANLHDLQVPMKGDTISRNPSLLPSLGAQNHMLQTSIFLVAHCGSGMSNSVVFRMDIEFSSWIMLDFVLKTQNFLTKLRPFGNQMNPVNKFTSGKRSYRWHCDDSPRIMGGCSPKFKTSREKKWLHFHSPNPIPGPRSSFKAKDQWLYPPSTRSLRCSNALEGPTLDGVKKHHGQGAPWKMNGWNLHGLPWSPGWFKWISLLNIGGFVGDL